MYLGWLMGNDPPPPHANADKDLRAVATRLCVADCVATALSLQAAAAPGGRLAARGMAGRAH